jgi:hypothetical protein
MIKLRLATVNLSAAVISPAPGARERGHRRFDLSLIVHRRRLQFN